MNNKKGQITIFVIIAVIIIAVVVLFFLIGPGDTLINPEGRVENPNNLLSLCLKDAVKEKAQEISSKGGYIENPFNRTFKFTDEDETYDVAFLCYTKEFYNPCVTQQPMMISHLEDELKNTLGKKVEDCVEEIGRNYEAQGYTVDVNYKDFNVELIPDEIKLDVDVRIGLSKVETSVQEGLNANIQSKLYNNAIVAQQIVFQNAKFCNFDYFGYMMTYPEFEIDYFRTSDSIKIYTIKELNSEEWFRLAIRTCVIPQGI